MGPLPEVSPASAWCQRWRDGRHRWRHRSEGGFDPAPFTVEPVAEATAKAYVLAHHYSRTYPAARLRYGLFAEGTLVGVAVLAVPMHEAVLTNVFPRLAPYDESLELSRFVLADACPANAESWFLARAFTEAASSGVRGVVSFADPMPRVVGGQVLFPGHVGTIYQASNAVFTGRSTARTLVVLPGGDVLPERALSKVRRQERGHEHVERRLVDLGAPTRRASEAPPAWLARALPAVGAVRLRHQGCFRYAFTLGRTRRERQGVVIAPRPSPYPKAVEPPAGFLAS